MNHKSVKNLFGALVGVVFTTLAASAATNTWVGNTDANWGTSGNWTFSSGVGPVASGDALVFGTAGSAGTALNNNIANLTVNKLTFNSGASSFTFGGNNITLGVGGIDASALSSGVQTFVFTNVIGSGLQRWRVGAGATLAFGKLGAGAGANAGDTYDPNGAIVIMSNTGTKTTTSADGWGWRGGAVAGTGLLGPGMVIDNGNNTYDWASAGNSGGPIVAATYTTAANSDAHNVKVTANTTVTPNASWASLVVQGATLTHNGGNIYLDTGIILQNGGVINGSGPLKANSDGLYIHVPDSGTIASSIQNNGANVKLLYKTGPGTLTLSGANTYTGNTVIYEGALVQSTAATGAGGYLVKDGATLGISGGGTLRMASLSLGNSALNFSTASTTAAAITNTGALTVTGTVTVNVGGIILPVGQYPLIASTSRVGTGGFVVGSLPIGNGANIVTNGNRIMLNVTVSQLPTFLWTGLNNNSWDFATANNWATNGGSVVYSDYQLVRFDDSSVRTNVNLAASVTPLSVVVSNSTRRYTFSGAAITGSASLTKSGTNTLVLANTNSYSGGTIINDGALQLGSGLGNNGIIAGNITVNGRLIFANATNETFSGVISGGGTLAKSGNNQLTLDGVNTFTGSLTISNGTLVVAKAQSLGTNITVRDGATLSVTALTAATSLAPVKLTVGSSSGATLQFGVAGTNHPVLAPGSVTLNGTTTIKITQTPYAKNVNFPLFTGYTGGSLVLGSEPKGAQGKLVVNAGTVSYVVTNFDFVHPGALHTQADFDRMRAKVQANASPWIDSYNILANNWTAQSNAVSHAQATLIRGGAGENYQFAYFDTATVYQLALRWKITGDANYANTAIGILNSWANINTSLAGDPNILLLELYGYQFACAAEILLDYPGWAPADVAKFRAWMSDEWYGLADAFLRAHFGSCSTHQWCNWDFAAMNAVMAISILCDDTNMYNQAVAYFKEGMGNGNIEQAIYFMHPGYMGQGQEMGRDQGHAALNVALIGAFCQMAYNQGDDLFAYQNNRVLAMCEYFAKFNIGEDVPYLPYKACDFDLQTNLGGSSRGNNRPCWDLIYNHYVHIKGLAAPWSEQYAARNRPDGGGSNYGGGGGYDQLGFTTLTCFLDPIAAGNPPSGLTAILNGSQQVQLNWWGTAYATSYYVKRATTSGGPYTTIATITTNLLTYSDSTVTDGGTYYYTISALTPQGESANGNEAMVSVQPQLLAFYKFNESSGITAADASGNGRTATLVGASWTAAGHSNNAVNLNGSGGYVSVPSGFTTNLTDFTIATWVYLNGAQGYWTRIFDFGESRSAVWGSTYYTTPTRYMFLAPSAGVMTFAITCGTSGGEQRITANQTMPVNGWQHVAVTLSGNTGTLYLNGVQVGQNVIPITPSQLGTLNTLYIGKSQWPDPYLNGRVDDFRIYSGALNAAQVAALAAGYPAQPAAPTNVVATPVSANQIDLTWSPATGATNYYVKRSTVNGGPYTTISVPLTQTNYSDPGLTSGTTYYYIVTAINDGGAINSAPVSARTVSLVATDVTVGTSGNQLQLSWPADHTGWRLLMNTNLAGPNWQEVAGANATNTLFLPMTNASMFYRLVYP